FGDNEANFPGPLTLDAAGNLFGTSFGGGDFNSGTAYKLTRTNGGWTYSTLYSFDLQSSSGGAPEGKIVLDQSGNLYSTCANGPYPSPDAGTVWEITP
ncbi:MAG: choice-of-anchor tandem repeat GloVer-containing protein, partial [Candidatus Korobacteraceae bacterium]